MDRRSSRGDSSQDGGNQSRRYGQYMQLENRPGGSQGEGESSSTSWWRSASRFLDRPSQQSTDVNRYVDLTEHRTRMTQQGRTFDWNKAANENGNLAFMEKFQRRLDRSSSLRQTVSEEIDRRQTERMQTVHRYVDLMEQKDLVTQQGFESEWNEQASENGDQAFMQKFRTRLGNDESGTLQQILNKELDQRRANQNDLYDRPITGAPSDDDHLPDYS